MAVFEKRVIFLLSLFIVFLGSSHSTSSHSLSHRKQASILLSLKRSFESSNPFLNSWNFSNYNSLCSWNGIKCHVSGKSIISLDISNYNLSGFLSPAITQLGSLINLSVAGNGFSGNFPSGIGNLSRLVFLNISNNQFNGSLEFEIAGMKELEFFDAYNNDFSGPLPLGVTQMPKLKHLDFGGNYFSREIPSSYGGMEKLNHLSLAGNDLRGYIPGELGNLTNLKQLYLGYFNQFEGGIPKEFGKLINLVHLDLSNCGLKGPIPPELRNLNKLDTLFIQTNQLTGSIPPQLGNLTKLKSLDLSNNGFTGEIPVELSALQELTLLNLFINKFNGSIPPFIAELPNLETIKLWMNNFTGSLPPKIGKNGKLVEIDLSTNRLTGWVPKSLCLGRKLKILILLNNFLSGPLPDDLGQCHSLSRVRLGQNYLNGSIPNGLFYLPSLSLLELQNNFFIGGFPEEKHEVLSILDQLNLSNNLFSGSLPISLGNFSDLKILLLSGNRFTGEIPAEIGKLKSMLKLDLSRNKLSGKIPLEMGSCLSLTYLDLSQNQLTGSIPIQISQIDNLNYLNISWNLLSDILPKEIGSMKSLTSADFSYNNFTGEIPQTGEYLFFNSTSFIGNPGLCGSHLSPCNYSSFSSEFTNQDDNKTKVSGKYKLILAFGLFLCFLIFIVFAIIKTKLRRNSNSWKLTTFQKVEFGSKEILECLKDNNIIGRGGAGIVYSGTMPNGEQVAIKKLGNNISNGSSHDNGLSAEIKTLGQIRHRYIVRLLAFCSNKETNLLVYEYMPNGSLGEVLHGKNGGVLKWDDRLKIAMEAAKGIAYLHHDCSPLILHRDVKSNNILLNSDFEAHVADFGLAKFLRDNGTSECMSGIAGSYGYIAPEYAYTLKVDEKSDVYSFGVVLLELITGKKPVGDFGEEGLDIVQWVKLQTNGIKEGVKKVIDDLLKNAPMEEAMQVFLVAMLCVEEHSVERPTMREVVQMLAQAKQPNTFLMQ